MEVEFFRVFTVLTE